MNLDVIIALSFSIAIAGVIGLVRYRQIHPSFYPFLYLIWLGLLNETITLYLLKVRHFYNNAVNNNIFFLLQSALVLYQFWQWKLFPKKGALLVSGLLLLTLFWVTENLVLGNLLQLGSYFLISHSLLIALLSVVMINQVIAREKGVLLKNASFLICTGFILYFINAALVEIFYLYGLGSSLQYRTYVTRILVFVNLFTNLLFAVAVLWMPKRLKFSI